MKIKRLGIIANIRKEKIRDVLSGVMEIIPEGIDIVGKKDTADLLDGGRIMEVDSFDGCEVVLALGGDGTLLMAARMVEKEEIPLLGIKIRSLGFLTEDDPQRAVKDLFNGRYNIEKRTRIEVSLVKGGEVRERFNALNEVVIHGVGVSRVLHIKTMIDSVMLGEYLADGVIVSTPTGSTAYSLSAGGPIINPSNLEAFIITPLYPHSLSVRPVVVSSSETCTVEVVDEGHETLVTIDGQQHCAVRNGEQIILGRSPRVTNLIVTEGYNFYDLVRRKLKWGGVLRRR